MIHDGYVTQNDFHSILNSDVYRKLEVENDLFRKQYQPFLEQYSKKWTDDSFHQWSRVWEYPYIYTRINQSAKEGCNILDAGCGLSFFPFLISREIENGNLFAVDYDSRLVDSYSEISHASGVKVKFDVGDLRKLSYPDESMDVIYCLSVLEHTTDYCEIIDGFHRMLKPGGRLILTLDISLDGDRRINITDAQEMMEYLRKGFRPIYEDCNVVNSEKHILTTKYVSHLNKELLPWRSPWKNAVKNLLSLKKPVFIYNLACFCQTFEKQ